MNRNAILTPRETQVAELLAWGAAKKEISDRLFISIRTVENTARSIYVKCNIQKATELCVWWFCTKCCVSWDLSPIKRTIVATIIFFAFFQSNIIEQRESEKYYRRTVRHERRAIRRNENEFDYLLV